jgi:hypothetical protein
MLLGDLYTAVCSCLLIVTCFVDAYKCRLPQLLFPQHCNKYNVMLHVVLAIALPRSWSVFSFRNVILNACRVVGLCSVYAADRCNTDLPSQLAPRKALPVVGLTGKRVHMIWRRFVPEHWKDRRAVVGSDPTSHRSTAMRVTSRTDRFVRFYISERWTQPFWRERSENKSNPVM